MPDPNHPADRLLEAIDRCGAPVCIGLDPVIDRLPTSLRPGPGASGDDVAGALLDFGRHVLDAVAGIVPCIKVQSACYERYHEAGISALRGTIAAAAQRGLEVILDFKRGDIGVSAEHYAASAFGEDDRSNGRQPAWVTVNSYLGGDGIAPFLRPGRGAFALVRTSNPGGDAIQELRLDDGRSVAEAVAGLVARLGESHLGARGYSALGAVVGATKPQAAARLRRIMPRQVFLVPGFGAQGGGAEDVRPCFDANGAGAIITASRSVIYAFSDLDEDWRTSIREAARRFADEIASVARSIGRG